MAIQIIEALMDLVFCVARCIICAFIEKKYATVSFYD